MNEAVRPPAEFAVKDCALVGIATGLRAQNLRELRDHLCEVHAGALYYHLWGGLLRPRFDDPEYNNDFASWARHSLHDAALAERLGVIDPGAFSDMEALRQELLETLEERLDELEHLRWAPREQQFHFTRAQIVVFDTGRRIKDPVALSREIGSFSLGSIFYHVIDARRRAPQNVDDFRSWLGCCGEPYAALCEKLAALDPYFVSLSELRTQLGGVFRSFDFVEARQ